MSTHVGDIFIDAKLDDSQYQSGLKKMDRGAGKIGAGIGRKLGKMFAVASFGKFIKDATSAGASLNAMGTIIDASLPHMTEQVDNFAKKAGQAFGLSETQAKGFVGRFASMASAMGYTEDQAYKMSTALTGLAGDVASYYHISADDAYAKLGAVFTGETEALKQLGVVMTQNALDTFALQQGYGMVTSQMSELEKTTLRYNFVMDRLKLASGDFAQYAYTWSGSIATIKLNWANFMATVGQGIINILLPLLQLIARISNALSALGARFGAWTRKVMGLKNSVGSAFGKKTQTDLANTGAGLGNVGSGLGGAGKQAGKAKKAVQALKRELLGFDKITKLQGEQGITSGDTGTGGGSGVGGGGGLGGFDINTGDIEEATSVIDYLSKIKIPDSLKEALNNLKDSLSGLFETLKNAGKWALDNVLKPLGSWIANDFAPALVNALASAIDVLNNAFKFLGTILEPLWQPLIKPIFEFIGDVAVHALELLKGGLDFVATALEKATAGFNVIKTAVSDVVEKWNALKELATNKVLEFKADLVGKVQEKFEKLKKWWNETKLKVKYIAVNWSKTASDKAKDAWEKFKEKWWKTRTLAVKYIKVAWSSDAVKKVKESWEKLKEWWKNRVVPVKQFKTEFVNTIKDAWKKLLDWWRGLQGGTKKFTVEFGFVDKLKSAWNGLANKVNGARAKSSVASALLPYIPTLAQGGYVTANTPQLAMIGDNRHEGEIVAPESKLKAMAQEVANANGTDPQVVALLQAILQAINSLDLNVELDGEKIKNNTVSRINQHTRTTGRLELII